MMRRVASGHSGYRTSYQQKTELRIRNPTKINSLAGFDGKLLREQNIFPSGHVRTLANPAPAKLALRKWYPSAAIIQHASSFEREGIHREFFREESVKHCNSRGFYVMFCMLQKAGFAVDAFRSRKAEIMKPRRKERDGA